LKSNHPFEQFEQAKSEQQLLTVVKEIHEGGYSSFRDFLEGFREKLKSFDDSDAEEVTALVEKAESLLPEPVSLSPSWENVWQELKETASYKIKALHTIPAQEREGEWQIVMDNPYTNQEIVCYPALSFLEAAYLYGYFRPTLKKNEYIRLQKIQNLLLDYGE
jgi:hypothetical protein